MQEAIAINPPDHLEIQGVIDLPLSKSITNRALIIRAMTAKPVALSGVSTARDSNILKTLLREFSSNEGSGSYDAGYAGTAMRFLTAFFALQPDVQILTGSDRMQNRPIGPLVDALRSLGANIDYLGKKGFPPLQIGEGNLRGGTVAIDGGISSQFISALMMVGPALPGGIHIDWGETLVSRPYVEMTAAIMENFGASVTLGDHDARIGPEPYQGGQLNIEPDWSAAGYWLEMAALSQKCDMLLPGLQQNSLQSDSVAMEICAHFGVFCSFERDGLRVKKDTDVDALRNRSMVLNCTNYPDLAQTIACTAAGSGISVELCGLQTLGAKETDRIAALKRELGAFGVPVWTAPDRLSITDPVIQKPEGSLKTYNDHRMAMAMAPLSLKTGNLVIEDPAVVRKSYPDYWSDMERCGFSCDVQG